MDWQRLAQAVIDRRVELGYRTRESFAAETGLSSRLLGDVERAKRDNYDRVTFARLEQALQWPSGTVRAVLRSAAAPADSPSRASAHQAQPGRSSAHLSRWELFELLAAEVREGRDDPVSLLGGWDPVHVPVEITAALYLLNESCTPLHPDERERFATALANLARVTLDLAEADREPPGWMTAVRRDRQLESEPERADEVAPARR